MPMLQLDPVKLSPWEKHKIAKPLPNRRWLIDADSLRAVPMTASGTSMHFRVYWRRHCLLLSSGSQTWPQIQSFLDYCFSSVWCRMIRLSFEEQFLFVLNTNRTVRALTVTLLVSAYVCFLVIRVQQLVHWLSLRDQQLLGRARSVCSAGAACAFWCYRTGGRKSTPTHHNTLCCPSLTCFEVLTL